MQSQRRFTSIYQQYFSICDLFCILWPLYQRPQKRYGRPP